MLKLRGRCNGAPVRPSFDARCWRAGVPRWHRQHPECIPLLTCHLHQGLIAHGEHLTHRCSSWTDDLHRQRGWAPEVA